MPRTVTMWIGRSGSGSIFWRSRRIVTHTYEGSASSVSPQPRSSSVSGLTVLPGVAAEWRLGSEGFAEFRGEGVQEPGLGRRELHHLALDRGRLASQVERQVRA